MSGVRSLTPSAARLTVSLRDIGYDFPAAVADLVDNSVSAGARHVEIVIEFEGVASRVLIADDGAGMTRNGLEEALRFGTRCGYGMNDLGRYGLGLKTASLSQARRISLLTRRGLGRNVSSATLDLDFIVEQDDWLIRTADARDPVIRRARELLTSDSGTVVVWQDLDRVLPEHNPEGGWARRRVEGLAARTAEHLAMVFHRFLTNELGEPLVITVNGEKLGGWDPFARDEEQVQELPRRTFEINVGDFEGEVVLQRFVLPSRDQFSSPAAFERLSGPLKWNRQQGLYIYRANRLVQWGGWGGMRGIDEHTKLGRAALDFSTSLDAVFQVNVAKMRTTIPSQLRPMLERPITELCLRADDAYRKTAKRSSGKPRGVRAEAGGDRAAYGLALRSAAAQSGQYAAFKLIVEAMRQDDPALVGELGLD